MKAPFAQWTREVCDTRNRLLAERKDLNIEIDPDIYEAFMKSTSICTQKGSAVGLLKIGSKRRRNAAETQQLKEEESLRHEALGKKDKEIEDLRL